jgi:hypothetical protein
VSNLRVFSLLFLQAVKQQAKFMVQSAHMDNENKLLKAKLVGMKVE